MRVGFIGMTHLGQTLSKAAEMRGIEVVRGLPDAAECDLVFVTEDVESDDDLGPLRGLIDTVLALLPENTPLVIVSQVVPGFTRPWLKRHARTYYQVDTLIMSCALERAMNPERHIVGSYDPRKPLPEVYQNYLNAFPAPVLQVGIEAAELTKLAVNFMLATQISAANTLTAIAEDLDADWVEISEALRLDRRIGERAYIEPGTIGGHLPRDVRRIQKMLERSYWAAFSGQSIIGAARGMMFANSIGPMQ